MDRPRHIDFGFDDSRASSAEGSRKGAPSPRIQHYDGDIPPSLSPLDAFAAHSRRLAKELEETRLAGQRRMSRLPPQIVTQSLSQHQASRPAIFRSLSSFSQEPVPPLPHFDTDAAGSSPDIVAPSFRPKSSHPRLSAVAGLKDQDRSQLTTPLDSPLYFGAARAESPEPFENYTQTRAGYHLREDSSGPVDDYPALAPPNAAFARNRPYQESSDDDYTSSNAGSFFSQTRKLSSSSNVSVPQAITTAHVRSSSNNSSASLPGQPKTASNFNFSRPMSSASSYAKLESPTRSLPQLNRKTSEVSEYTRKDTSFDDVRSVVSEGIISHGPSSYTHSRFNLPRGRAVDRTSWVFTSPPTPSLEWSGSLPSSSAPQSPAISQDHAFTPLDQVNNDIRARNGGDFSFDFGSDGSMLKDQPNRPSSSHTQSGSTKSSNSLNVRPSTGYAAQKIPDLPPIPGSSYSVTTDGVSQSSRSNSTVRPSTARSVSNYANLTSDDHVTKAIDLHQHGDLKESTYHLRIAAKQNHGTGMLLYALACRHGWGMRSNPKEGVAWLKKAVDLAMLEVAEDENDNGENPKSDFHQKKEHRAQFALSIYELGVSHLNGWGVEQDKSLALRCFEIAGGWGDPDALSEAGFCYSEGVGCKKDLKKAARFYRMAAAKGVSMVGNSWIYKEKYSDSKDVNRVDLERGRVALSPKNSSSSAGRSKSKTRNIFGRKKSMVATA